MLTLLQFGTLLAVVLVIARPGGLLRDVLALRRPSSWKRAAGIGVLVAVSSLFVLIAFDSLLGAGEAQRLAAGWDPTRASAFAVNAALIILVGPVVEELTFRGLGFALLERFGHGWAIALTAAAFALSHGLIALLPASAVFGAGLAYLRSRTRSVYPGIVLHVVFNALGVAGSTLQ
ncbi:MAG: CPBP family intramembrane glutamic endopeptidase [Gaiellaceae bacterium]